MLGRGGLKAPLALARVVAPRADHVLERLLDRHAPRTLGLPVLEAGSGPVPLRPLVEARGWRWIGVEHAAGEAATVKQTGQSAPVHADLRRLPFDDDAFDLVVSHGLQLPWHDEHSCAQVVAEMVRASRGLVVAAWWDGEALRPRVPWPKSGPGRRPLQRALLRELFEDAGASVVEWRHSFRFVSQQAWLVARKRAVVRLPRTAGRDLSATVHHASLGPLGA